MRTGPTLDLGRACHTWSLRATAIALLQRVKDFGQNGIYVLHFITLGESKDCVAHLASSSNFFECCTALQISSSCCIHNAQDQSVLGGICEVACDKGFGGLAISRWPLLNARQVYKSKGGTIHLQANVDVASTISASTIFAHMKVTVVHGYGVRSSKIYMKRCQARGQLHAGVLRT